MTEAIVGQVGADRARRVLASAIVATAALGALLAATIPAGAQDAVAPLKIGVLTDLSGPYADSGGPGSVLAAQMAAQDFGGLVNRRKIEIVAGDTLNKPDVATAVARRWFESEAVSAVVDLPVTPVAFGVQALAKQMNKTVMITAAATSDFTVKACAPQSSHWADDTHALAAGTARELLAGGASSWQFIAVDISFGAALVKEASDVVTAGGGSVTGVLRHGIGAQDYSSQLLQAQASKAKIIGLASVGNDLVNIIKQSKEFGIGADGSQSLVAFLVYITDINALGLDVARNLVVTSSFYWDQSDQSRAFAKRFFETRHAMPTKNQAAVYAAVSHYLKAVGAAASDEAVGVGAAMKTIPVDYFGKTATMRSDGRVLFDLDVYRVKAKEAQKAPWDYYERIRTIAAKDAFLPAAAACGG